MFDQVGCGLMLNYSCELSRSIIAGLAWAAWPSQAPRHYIHSFPKLVYGVSFFLQAYQLHIQLFFHLRFATVAPCFVV
jgi:hypothetical protein